MTSLVNLIRKGLLIELHYRKATETRLQLVFSYYYYYHHLLLALAQIIELNLNSAICWMA